MGSKRRQRPHVRASFDMGQKSDEFVLSIAWTEFQTIRRKFCLKDYTIASHNPPKFDLRCGMNLKEMPSSARWLTTCRPWCCWGANQIGQCATFLTLVALSLFPAINRRNADFMWKYDTMDIVKGCRTVNIMGCCIWRWSHA